VEDGGDYSDDSGDIKNNGNNTLTHTEIKLIVLMITTIKNNGKHNYK
jgi:hypothetical protein